MPVNVWLYEGQGRALDFLDQTRDSALPTGALRENPAFDGSISMPYTARFGDNLINQEFIFRSTRRSRKRVAQEMHGSQLRIAVSPRRRNAALSWSRPKPCKTRRRPASMRARVTFPAASRS